jgi:hypothetical protein
MMELGSMSCALCAGLAVLDSGQRWVRGRTLQIEQFDRPSGARCLKQQTAAVLRAF